MLWFVLSVMPTFPKTAHIATYAARNNLLIRTPVSRRAEETVRGRFISVGGHILHISSDMRTVTVWGQQRAVSKQGKRRMLICLNCMNSFFHLSLAQTWKYALPTFTKSLLSFTLGEYQKAPSTATRQHTNIMIRSTNCRLHNWIQSSSKHV